AIEVHLERDAFRQRRPDAVERGHHALGHRDRVRARLLLDADADRRQHVRARRVAVILRADLDVRDVAEPHDIAAGTAADRQLAEGRRRRVTGLGAQREVALRALEPARRELYVLAAQRALDVADRDAVRDHALAVEPYAHRVAALA